MDHPDRTGLRVEHRDDLLVLELHRPDRRNAFDSALCNALQAALDDIPPDTRAVVLTGAGSVFCAGADLAWFGETGDSAAAAMARMAEVSALFARLDALSVPLVARLNGPAAGGGVGLAALADITVAADTATFQLAEVRAGLVPAMIAPYLLRRLDPGRLREWALTGERIDAWTAFAWGLVGTVAVADRLDEALDKRLELLRAGSAPAQATIKSFLRRLEELPGDEVADDALRTSAGRLASPDAAERIRRFLRPKER